MSKWVKTKTPFNKTIIKDGWIVRIRKNGTIAAKLERYTPGQVKVK
jgi:hypothetical protein